jgi:hypothetical protein
MKSVILLDGMLTNGARSVASRTGIASLDDAVLIRERPRSKPHPSVVVRQRLADQSEVEVVWAWLPESRRAMLVTVYFRDE